MKPNIKRLGDLSKHTPIPTEILKLINYTKKAKHK